MHKPWKTLPRHSWKSSSLQELSCRLGWRNSQTMSSLSPPESGCEQHTSTSSLPLPLGHEPVMLCHARRASRATAQHTNTCLIHRTTEWMRWEGASWPFSLYLPDEPCSSFLMPHTSGKSGFYFLLYLLISRLNHPHTSHTPKPCQLLICVSIKTTTTTKRQNNHQQQHLQNLNNFPTNNPKLNLLGK